MPRDEAQHERRSVLKAWAAHQATVAVSSGEAKYYTAGKVAVAHLGWTARPRLCVDSSAAQGMACQQGVGRPRHLDVLLFWPQQACGSGALRLSKVVVRANPAGRSACGP